MKLQKFGVGCPLKNENAQEQSHGDKSALPALQDFRIHGFSAALTKGNRGLYRKNGARELASSSA